MNKQTPSIRLKTLNEARVQVRAFKPEDNSMMTDLQDEQVRRLLRHDATLLTESERAFLTLASAFRTPLTPAALVKALDVLRDQQLAPLHRLDDEDVNAMIVRLVDTGLLRHDLRTDAYVADSQVRAHYLARLATCTGDESHGHSCFNGNYPTLAQAIPQLATLDDLRPLIENARRARINEHANEPADATSQAMMAYQMGAYETDLLLLKEFFPNGDLAQDPEANDSHNQSWILNEVGLCQTHMGQLHQAFGVFKRAGDILVNLEDWSNASAALQNQAHLAYYLGNLEQSAMAASQALDLARRAGDREAERDALATGAWAAHLYGHIEMASKAFSQAQRLARQLDTRQRYLRGRHGVWHADHLQRIGKVATARRVTEVNLAEWAIAYGWLQDESRCYRILGDLDALHLSMPSQQRQRNRQSRRHYNKALWIAHGITDRPTLIEALLARGRWAARQGGEDTADHEAATRVALSDLHEALRYARADGYRIYEADIRVALAWAHHHAGDRDQAQREIDQARRLSMQLGYYWGKVDVGEVLAAASRDVVRKKAIREFQDLKSSKSDGLSL